MKLELKKGRDRLTEGKTSGLAFGFAQKKDNKIIGITPISACKDYLNDVVYTEHTKKTISAYGLSTKYQGLFEEGKAYLLAQLVVPIGQSVSDYMKSRRKQYRQLYEKGHALYLLNEVEKSLDIPESTIEYLKDDVYLITIDKKWVTCGPMISLCAGLIRLSQMSNPKLPVAGIMILSGATGRGSLVNSTLQTLQLFKEGITPDPEFYLNKNRDNMQVHNGGIVSWITDNINQWKKETT